ncbi:MAG: hypothetical protein H7837_11190 [Magnetococcus sp. MYC-9]
MTRHTQQPVARILELDPDAGSLSLWHRRVEVLVAAIRSVVQARGDLHASVQPSAKPFSIIHPWRRWRWFN